MLEIWGIVGTFAVTYEGLPVLAKRPPVGVFMVGLLFGAPNSRGFVLSGGLASKLPKNPPKFTPNSVPSCFFVVESSFCCLYNYSFGVSIVSLGFSTVTFFY